MSYGCIVGTYYIESSLVDFNIIEEIFGKIVKNKKDFVFFLKGFLDVDDELSLQHF